jgi:hypothetical protein
MRNAYGAKAARCFLDDPDCNAFLLLHLSRAASATAYSLMVESGMAKFVGDQRVPCETPVSAVDLQSLDAVSTFTCLGGELDK